MWNPASLSSLLGFPDLGMLYKNLGIIQIFGKSVLDKVMKAILSQKRSDLKKKKRHRFNYLGCIFIVWF